MSTKKKKPTVSPEAARILEQYRNAGKPPAALNPDGTAIVDAEGGPANHPTQHAAPPIAKIQRSGNRGK